MKHILAVMVVLTLVRVSVADARQSSGIRIHFTEGRLSVTATDALVADVLAEWRRLGGTDFAGGDPLPGRRVTLAITDEDEEDALRTIAGPEFGLAANVRSARVAGASRFARVTFVAMRTVDSPVVTTDLKGPPEARYSYETAEHPWPALPAAAGAPTTAGGAEPEAVFEYSQPTVAPPGLGGASAANATANSQGPGGPQQDPERRFEYSMPTRAWGVLELSPTDMPAPDRSVIPPSGDPESRFHYFVPARAVPPRDDDGTNAGETEGGATSEEGASATGDTGSALSGGSTAAGGVTSTARKPAGSGAQQRSSTGSSTRPPSVR